MKAIWNQLGFYLFFVLLAVGCVAWAVQAARNPDASQGELLSFIGAAVAALALAVFTYRYEKRHNLNQ